jgi:RHS repeat-associated protein
MTRWDRSVPRLAQYRTAATGSGLCGCRTRQGHPVWLNRDPVFEPGGISLYGFVGNNPISRVDPFGECWNPFSADFWGELLEKMAGKNPRQWDPNSNIALRAEEDVAPEGFEDASGNPVSGAHVAALVGGAVAAGLVNAMTDGVGRPAAVSPLKGKAATEAAGKLGFTKRIPPQNAPFNTHGQPLFQKGNRFITPDVDSHKGGVWKLLDASGKRLGTCDADLNIIAD